MGWKAFIPLARQRTLQKVGSMCDLGKADTLWFSAFFTQGLLSWKTGLLPASSSMPPIPTYLFNSYLTWAKSSPPQGTPSFPSLARHGWLFRSCFYSALITIWFSVLCHNLMVFLTRTQTTTFAPGCSLPRERCTWHTQMAQRGREMDASQHEGAWSFSKRGMAVFRLQELEELKYPLSSYFLGQKYRTNFTKYTCRLIPP